MAKKAKKKTISKTPTKATTISASHPLRKVDPLTLKLDALNPRFAAYGGGRRSEKNVIEYLLDTADLRELVASIAANGYIDLEPLIVLNESQGSALTVIEGNRRVAAIRLLRNPDLAAELGVNLPPMTAADADTLTSASVREVGSREEARQYIGFKHINGPHKWDAFAKGKYAADWYREEKAGGVTIRDIAHRLGDRHDTILRLVNGICVLEQAKKEGLFTLDDRAAGRPFFFSHLYTALARSQYREYLGLDAEWRQVEPKANPVPRSHLDQLRRVLLWIYGSASERLEPVVKSQNPNIKELGEVLSNPLALKRLESTNDLRMAFTEVATRSRKFEESLIRSVKHAEEAQQFVEAYDGDPTLVEFGVRLTKIGQVLVRSMKEIRNESKDGDS